MDSTDLKMVYVKGFKVADFKVSVNELLKLTWSYPDFLISI